MSRLAIVGATLIDGAGNDPVPDSLVLIDGERIELVGTLVDRAALAPDDTLLDGRGLALLPGLINCHDHVFQKGLRSVPSGEAARNYRARLMSSSEMYLSLVAAHNARVELSQGITTTVDLGSPARLNIHLRNAIDEGLVPGPRIIACGEAVTMTGGHIHTFSREADGPDEVRKAVREQLRAGADVIKVMASGGLTAYPSENPGQVEYTVDELRAATEEAHKRERRITTHATAAQSVWNALEAGLDCIEHGFLAEPASIVEMAKRGTHFVPTVNIPNRKYRSIPGATESPLARYLAQEVVPVHRRAVQTAADAGVLIGAGTDTPGLIYEEIEILVDYGFTPKEALLTVAGAAARICGVAHDRGTVETGKLADLLLVDGAPWRDITELRRVHTVIKGGKLVDGALPVLETALMPERVS